MSKNKDKSSYKQGVQKKGDITVGKLETCSMPTFSIVLRYFCKQRLKIFLFNILNTQVSHRDKKYKISLLQAEIQ